MKLVIGLGNPGRTYLRTRHNLGFRVVEELAVRHGLRFSKRQFSAEIAEGTVAGVRALLVKPQTFMNASGDAVAPLAGYYQVAPEDILVVHDDLDLTPGKIRIRRSGSAGGHRGIASLIERLGRNDFPRVKIGIGHPEGPIEVVDYVLQAFSPDVAPLIDQAVAGAADAVEVFLTDGLDAAMRQFNVTSPTTPESDNPGGAGSPSHAK